MPRSEAPIPQDEGFDAVAVVREAASAAIAEMDRAKQAAADRIRQQITLITFPFPHLIQEFSLVPPQRVKGFTQTIEITYDPKNNRILQRLVEESPAPRSEFKGMIISLPPKIRKKTIQTTVLGDDAWLEHHGKILDGIQDFADEYRKLHGHLPWKKASPAPKP